MINRWIGLLTLLAMLAANAALLWHDILPRWLAGDPPPNFTAQLEPGEQRRSQIGIFAADGATLGRAWTIVRRFDDTTTVASLTVLRPPHLPVEYEFGSVRIETRLTYVGRAYPVSLEMEVHGLPITVSLRGEAFAGDFGCVWEVGGSRGEFRVSAELLRSFGDSLRPFDRLPGLVPGQTWRMQVVDPLSVFGAAGTGQGITMRDIIVRVRNAPETISDPRTGAPVETLVVEARELHTVAWVDRSGRVLRQRVRLPLFGELTLIDEPFDEDAYDAALARRWMEQGADAPAPAEMPQEERR